jgi:hypothetical protein
LKELCSRICPEDLEALRSRSQGGEDEDIKEGEEEEEEEE